MPNEREIAATLMKDAAKIVSTERGQQHGDLEDSFNMIAELVSTYINHSVFRATGIMPTPRITLNAVDMLEIMSLVKKARNVYGGKLPDHTIDDIGYTGLAGGLRLRDVINKRVQDEVSQVIQSQGANAVADALASAAGTNEQVPPVEPPAQVGEGVTPLSDNLKAALTPQSREQGKLKAVKS